MIWFDNIASLPFYQPNTGCYCEPLVLPTDLMLQGSFPKVNQVLGFGAYLKSPDGLVEYEVITGYFSIYYFEFNGKYYFNLRLNRFSPEMCIKKCWIIEIEIFTDTLGTAFDKYTQRYCTATCCEVASGVQFEQDAILVTPDISRPTNPVLSPYQDECGDKLVRLISRFPCYNAFADEFYGTPDVVIGGNPASFELTKVTTLRGRFVRRPREIVRQVSYNCKLQRAESAREYLLESYDIFPAWKMEDIENQLHAPYIWVEDYPSYKEYQFAGGTVFSKPDGARDCTEVFKLSANFQDCVTRQTFGCDAPCNNTNYAGYSTFFIVPENYQGGNFYDDSKTLVASDIYSLADWFMSQEGIYSADVLFTDDAPSPALSPLPSPLSCPIDYVIGIKAYPNTYIPTSLYFDKPVGLNKIYQSNFEQVSEICDLSTPTCATPVLGSVSDVPQNCATPVLGTVTDIVITPIVLDMIQYTPMGWEYVITGSPAMPEDTNAVVYENQVTFSIKVRNTAYAGIDDDETLSGEIIGIIGVGGRPAETVFLNSSNNGNLTADQFITIDPNGLITYTGYPTSVNLGSYAEIQLTDLIFEL